MLVSVVWNSFVKLGLPVLSLALLALQGNASPRRITTALIGIAALVAAIAVFASLLRSQPLAERFGLLAGGVASRLLGLVGRPPVTGWELATAKFRTRTLELLQGGWVPITAATLVSHLSLYAVLLVSLRHVGVSDAEVSWTQVLVVFAFARLATVLPFMPGGIGVVELVLIGWLTAAGGDPEQVTAAVLVLPGPHLGTADPGRGLLLCVVAPGPATAQPHHRRRPADGHPQGRRNREHPPTAHPAALRTGA
jgi:uncharacterized membrane protein YbhN (UPF0104 family)